ncbi:hypothetical protein HK104_000526 [Borealophlyctis nickersoniae]|nr:hypothetical protein HK104_000526 [Borealophlyctis nickersoniae]
MPSIIDKLIAGCGPKHAHAAVAKTMSAKLPEGLGTLPLITRKNIVEYEPKKVEALRNISKALGGSWTFNADFVKIYGAIPNEDHKQRLGEIVYGSYLMEFADNIESKASDSMFVEFLNAAAPNKKITFTAGTVDPENPGDRYHDIDFKDGNINITASAESFWTNVNQVGYHIDKKLLT